MFTKIFAGERIRWIVWHRDRVHLAGEWYKTSGWYSVRRYRWFLISRRPLLRGYYKSKAEQNSLNEVNNVWFLPYYLKRADNLVCLWLFRPVRADCGWRGRYRNPVHAKRMGVGGIVPEKCVQGFLFLLRWPIQSHPGEKVYNEVRLCRGSLYKSDMKITCYNFLFDLCRISAHQRNSHLRWGIFESDQRLRKDILG